MLIGGSDGRLTYYENIGTPLTAQWDAPVVSYLSIDVGSYSVPALGVLAVLVGTQVRSRQMAGSGRAIGSFLALQVMGGLAIILGVTATALALPSGHPGPVATAVAMGIAVSAIAAVASPATLGNALSRTHAQGRTAHVAALLTSSGALMGYLVVIAAIALSHGVLNGLEHGLGGNAALWRMYDIAESVLVGLAGGLVLAAHARWWKADRGLLLITVLVGGPQVLSWI